MFSCGSRPDPKDPGRDDATILVFERGIEREGLYLGALKSPERPRGYSDALLATADMAIGMVVEEEFLARAMVERNSHLGVAMPIGHKAERTETAASTVLVERDTRPPMRRLGIDALRCIGQRAVGEVRPIRIRHTPQCIDAVAQVPVKVEGERRCPTS